MEALSFSPPHPWLKLPPIAHVLGWFVIIIGISLIFPGAIAYITKEPSAEVFFFSSFFGIFLGGLLVTSCVHHRYIHFTLRENFILTFAAWISTGAIAALPIFLSQSSPTFLDAFFEAISCLTTTGISLLPTRSHLPESLKFWNIFLQWLGGFGIVLMALTILPSLKSGGSQIVSTEFSDRSEKMMPRSSRIATWLLMVYGAMTFLGALGLWISSMPFHQAFYYSISAISTGGITVDDQNLLHLRAAQKGILCLLMAFGGFTLSTFLGALLHFRKGKFLKFLFWDEQMRGYLKAIVFFLMAFILLNSGKFSILDHLFTTLSCLSTSGFFIENQWNSATLFIMILASFLGGCSGSTAGGIKIFRLQILYKMAKNHILSLIKPYALVVLTYHQRFVPTKTIETLVSIVFFYIASWIALSLALSAFGMTLEKSLTLAASVLTNSGIAFDAEVLKALAVPQSFWKATLIIGMLCGRFECITLVVALSMLFVRR